MIFETQIVPLYKLYLQHRWVSITWIFNVLFSPHDNSNGLRITDSGLSIVMILVFFSICLIKGSQNIWEDILSWYVVSLGSVHQGMDEYVWAQWSSSCHHVPEAENRECRHSANFVYPLPVLVNNPCDGVNTHSGWKFPLHVTLPWNALTNIPRCVL